MNSTPVTLPTLKVKKFFEIDNGTAFLRDNALFIKINPISTSRFGDVKHFNAFAFCFNDLVEIPEDGIVVPVTIDVTVNEFEYATNIGGSTVV